jgi:endo-1,4-beta-xylanase
MTAPIKNQAFPIKRILLWATLLLLVGPLQAATVVSWEASQVTGGTAATTTTSAAFNPATPVATSGYTGAPIYRGFHRTSNTGSATWGVANDSGNGLRVNYSSGALNHTVSSLFMFKMSKPVEFTAANDLLSAENIRSSRASRLSSVEVQFVVEEDGRYYISASSGNLKSTSSSLATSYAVRAKTIQWYEYNPTTSATAVAAIGFVPASPAFTDIDFIGFRLVTKDPTGSVNVGVRKFTATAVRPSLLAAGKNRFLGQVYSPSQETGLIETWNKVTSENSGKWGSVEATRDVMNWTDLDEAYRAAKDNGYRFQFHVLVWGNQAPNWISGLSPADQLIEIKEWFAAVAARYPDIDYVEVVNEPLHNLPDGGTPPEGGSPRANYIAALGGAGTTGWDWVIKSFELARQYFPNARLMINDFNIVGNSTKTAQYLTIIDLLNARGLIDVIGMQGHSFSTTNPTATQMTSTLNSLAGTGLPLQITELDIDGAVLTNGVYVQDDERQRSEYARIFPVFWTHPAVMGVTLWGWRPGLWRNDEKAYLLEANGTERPAFVWLRDYVAGTEQPLNAAASAALGITTTYTLNISPAATNGTVSGAGAYSSGATATLAATPANGYIFVGWTGGAAGTANPLSVVMNANKTIGATFTTSTKTLTITTAANGTVSVGGTFSHGATATLTATPAEGYVFDQWTGDASGTANPLSVTMDANKTIGATFIQNNTDADNDGLPDRYETGTGVWVNAANTGTKPDNNDTDGDGLIDGVETNTGLYISPTNTGTNPNIADTDGDRLSDGVETNTRIFVSATNTGTSPLDTDTSGDGFSDSEGVTYGFDPNEDYTALVNFVGSQGPRFGLYNTTSMQILAEGGLVLPAVGNTVTMQIQFETKENLSDLWTGLPIQYYPVELPLGKTHLRVRSLGPK